MENLKIRVNSEAESREVQELFFELGYTWSGDSKDIFDFDMPEYIVNWNNGYITVGDDFDKNRQEITLPELRDLVVLKRNDVGDATHEGSITDNVYYVSSDEEVYRFESSAWCFSTVIVADLKPIKKKEMKEHLRKNSNGTYSYIGMVRPEHVSDFMIEIPEWAVAYADHKNGHGFFYDSFCKIASFYNIVWSRHTHPEELPFIDDEPLQSLNDQYAEIEKVRQSAWQKQEGGSHYKNFKIQPMQYALENKLDYAQANVVKYVTRHKEKNGKEDLLKAIHNLELMIEFYYRDEK